MEEVEPELEELQVAEAVGLALHDLDLAVQPLQWTGGNTVLEVGYEAGTVGIQGVGELGEVAVAQAPGLMDPLVQERFPDLSIRKVPPTQKTS